VACRSFANAMLTAAVDTPSPRASSLWFRYTPWSSIRLHSLALHPTGFRSITGFVSRFRSSENEI
jgi:hypothetical protein